MTPYFIYDILSRNFEGNLKSKSNYYFAGFRIAQCKKATIYTRKAVHCQVDGG